jgi:hypothetical protein
LATSGSSDWLVGPKSKMRSSTTAISEYLSLRLRSTVATRATGAWRDVGRQAACTDDVVRKGRQAPIAVSAAAGCDRTVRTTELYVATSRDGERYASPFSSHQIVGRGSQIRLLVTLWSK